MTLKGTDWESRCPSACPAAKRYELAKPERMRNIFKPGPTAHVRKGLAYHLVNSLRGLRAARRARKRRADRDLQMTRDGVIVVCHWARPLLRDQFLDPLREVSRHQRVDQMSWAQVRRLRTRKGGYRINTLLDDLTECGRLGLGAVLEPKTGDPRWRDVGMWIAVKRFADLKGARVSGYVLRANKAAAPAMNQAGIPTKVLGR